MGRAPAPGAAELDGAGQRRPQGQALLLVLGQLQGQLGLAALGGGGRLDGAPQRVRLGVGRGRGVVGRLAGLPLQLGHPHLGPVDAGLGRARCALGTSGRAERMAAITAALVAVTCDWTCWKADSAAPVGSPAPPPSDEAASTPPGPAAPGRRPGRTTARRPAPAPHLLPVLDHQPLDPRRRRRLHPPARRLHRPGALTRSTTSAARTGSAAYRSASPESHPARTSTPTSKRAAAARSTRAASATLPRRRPPRPA